MLKMIEKTKKIAGGAGCFFCVSHAHVHALLPTIGTYRINEQGQNLTFISASYYRYPYPYSVLRKKYW